MTEPRTELACGEVGDRLRELAANIIRVTRGAGRAFDISLQAEAFLKAMVEHRNAIGYYPSAADLKQALRIDDPVSTQHVPADRLDELYPRQMIVRGALQVAASRLLQQGAEQAVGEAEILKGIREFQKAEDAARRRQEAEQEAALVARRAAEKARRLELNERRTAEKARKAAARERRAKRVDHG
jgi:hypothetical protein